jgi:cytochrome c nitrite reductase small subunit
MRLMDAILLKNIRQPYRTIGHGLLGCCVGGGLYLATISNAASYLSDDPKACINCHVMEPEYASWQHSSHARVATCNDCHVPHDSTINKYWFKAKDGLRHSYLYTTGQERQVIQAIDESKKVIQANCLRCHGDLVAEARTPMGHTLARSCTDCHREVPHGRVHSLSSTPNAAIPPLSPVFKRIIEQGAPTKEVSK